MKLKLMLARAAGLLIAIALIHLIHRHTDFPDMYYAIGGMVLVTLLVYLFHGVGIRIFKKTDG